MKKIVLLLGALAFAAGCSGNNNSSSSGSTSGTTTTGTTGTTSATTTGSTTTGGGSTGQTGSSTTTTGGSSSTTGSSGSTGGSGSSGSSGTSATCDGAGVANDACGGAIALTAGTPVSGDFTNAKTDFSVDTNGTCSGAFSIVNDEVYTFTPSSSGTYRFTLTPGTGSSLDGVVIVTDSCPSGAISACLAASDNAGVVADSAKATLTGGTTYYVVVGPYDCSAVGTFTLDVEPVIPPSNDLCANATPLTVHAAGDTQTISNQDTTDANDETGSFVCGGNGGPDVYYALTLSSAAHVVVNATSQDSQNSFFTAELLADCSGVSQTGEAELGCGLNGADGVLDFGDLPAGSYIIAVDTQTDTSGTAYPGKFDLTVTASAALSAPANDLCANAVALTPAAPGDSQTVTLDTSGASNEQSGDVSCPSIGADVYYTLTLTAAAHLQASMTVTDGGLLADGGTTALPALVLTEGCSASDGGAPATVGCGLPQNYGSTSLDIGHVPAGTYTLRADNLISTTGAYDLNVTLGADVPPPANDNCSQGAIAVPLTAQPDGGMAGSVHFDTTSAQNDSESDPNGTCGGGLGPDEVFSVTLSAAVPSLTATIVPDQGSTLDNGNPLLYIRTSPCFDAYPADGGAAPATELACGYGDPTQSQDATATATTVAAGTYYIWVDGYNSTRGPGTLQLSVP